jgi:hypothetical protein
MKSRQAALAKNGNGKVKKDEKPGESSVRPIRLATR